MNQTEKKPYGLMTAVAMSAALSMLAQSMYLKDFDDIDSFGAGTIFDIQMAFEKISEKYGAETLVSPSILAGM